MNPVTPNASNVQERFMIPLQPAALHFAPFAVLAAATIYSTDLVCN